MSVALYTFDKPREDARHAAWLAQQPMAALHVFPAKEEQPDYSPTWKMTMAVAAAVLGPALVFGPWVYSLGVQAGRLPW